MLPQQVYIDRESMGGLRRRKRLPSLTT